MPGLAFKQAVVKRSQFRIFHMLPQQIEPFATSGFNEPGDEQTIDARPGSFFRTSSFNFRP